MENIVTAVIDIPLMFKIGILVLLVILVKLFLKSLKLSLPYFVKQPKIRYRFQDISSLTCGLVLILTTVVMFANEIKEFAIPFSIVGAGIAFALQEFIVNIAGRIVVVTTNLYQVGDRVQIGEMQGDVINIGLLRTSLMEVGNWIKADQYSGRVVHVTNSLILKENVINYSATFPFVWDEIIVPVRYASDQYRARNILLGITKAVTDKYKSKAEEKWQDMKARYMIDFANFEPAVTLVANDNWLEFTVRYIVPFNNRRAIKDQLFMQIVDDFARTKGMVEFASMTVEITNLPPVNVDSSAITEGKFC